MKYSSQVESAKRFLDTLPIKYKQSGPRKSDGSAEGEELGTTDTRESLWSRLTGSETRALAFKGLETLDRFARTKTGEKARVFLDNTFVVDGKGVIESRQETIATLVKHANSLLPDKEYASLGVQIATHQINRATQFFSAVKEENERLNNLSNEEQLSQVTEKGATSSAACNTSYMLAFASCVGRVGREKRVCGSRSRRVSEHWLLVHIPTF